MKTFKQFINEGVTDYLKGKSENDILNTLTKLSDNEKIKYIITYKLDYDLLPRNKDGICIYNGNLDCRYNQLTSLPDNLTVNGDLDCGYNNLTSLPDNLTVNGGLYCDNNQLTSLPNNLTVNGYLNCSHNQLTSLPNNLTVNGYLNCSHNQLTSLPNNLTVNGYLNCRNNKVKLELPSDAKIRGKFYN